MILPLIIGIILGGIVGVIAEQKNRPFFPWALYGFFFFFFAIIHIAVIGDKQYEDWQLRGMGYVKCAACAEMIRKDALICKHCGVKVGTPPDEIGATEPDPKVMGRCRWCNAAIRTDYANKCPSCGGLQRHFLRDNPVLMVLLFFLVAAFFVVLAQVSETPPPTAPIQKERTEF